MMRLNWKQVLKPPQVLFFFIFCYNLQKKTHCPTTKWLETENLSKCSMQASNFSREDAAGSKHTLPLPRLADLILFRKPPLQTQPEYHRGC